MKKLIYAVVATATITSYAQTVDAPLLPADQAFPLEIRSDQEQHATLSWQIPDHYYLYQHTITVEQNQQKIPLTLPPAVNLYDDNYGQTQVYFDHLKINLKTQPNQKYSVTWQGCAKDRLCYPPQRIDFQTDQFALVTQQTQNAAAPSLLALSAENQQTVKQESEQANIVTSSNAVAKDQHWYDQLSQHSFVYGLLLFFGLGILLAFTPCSLPMLPILSSLIVRDRKGLAAWIIALTFVTCMALVYALLGLVASSAGLNFQRWLQQPSTLIIFSAVFVLFALNLFGLFELQMPQRILHRLDRIQSMQKGGSLVSAGIMGMLSALLVGPCMTAPLAGALLFISQTQSQWQGALLLFTLGFGMGMPLLLASILGSRILPKAGVWMHQVKVIFAFMMLALALYFIRPLLSSAILQWLSLVLGLAFIAYVLHRLLWHKGQLKWLYIVALLIGIPSVLYSQYQYSQRFLVTDQTAEKLEWQVATTADEFNSIMKQLPQDRPVVIDVYADWCVACQPIEHGILKSPQVQQALSDMSLVKLDLSHYDASHQALLNQWEILGPPTYLFLNKKQQEQRHLRLTGAFTEAELLKQLQELNIE